MAGGWIDVSVPLRTGMVHWPDNPPVRIEFESSIQRGDVANVSTLSLGAHTGTHMDAPLHFIPDGAGIDQVPFDAVIGPARVIEIQDPVSIRATELVRHHMQAGERVLFKTRNSRLWAQGDQFAEDFVFIDEEAARYLANAHVQTIGVDYLSVGGYHVDGAAVHRTLLAAGIWIIEGLDLSLVAPGAYELVCLPLKIPGRDGAPSRAVLRPQPQI